MTPSSDHHPPGEPDGYGAAAFQTPAGDPASTGRPGLGYGTAESRPGPGYDQSAFRVPEGGGGNLSRNVPGRIALIAGVVLVLWQLTRILVVWSMTASDVLGLIRAAHTAFTVGEILLGLAATIAGAVGLAGAQRPRGSAAAGLALGVSSLLFLATNLLAPVLLSL